MSITPYRKGVVPVPPDVRRAVCGMGSRNAARRALGVSECVYAELVHPVGVVTPQVLVYVQKRLMELG